MAIAINNISWYIRLFKPSFRETNYREIVIKFTDVGQKRCEIRWYTPDIQMKQGKYIVGNVVAI